MTGGCSLAAPTFRSPLNGISRSQVQNRVRYGNLVKTATPSVSIVIPAHNEHAVLRDCLIAAIHQTVAAREIVVVDNRSGDGTETVVNAFQKEHPNTSIRYVRQDDQPGLIPTRNFGFDQAKGNVIGRIDADSRIGPGWVEEVQQVFADARISAATGPVFYYDMPFRSFGIKGDDRTRRMSMRLAGRYPFLFGSNMAIRTTVWLAVRDGTCPDIEDRMHEDIDLSIHLARHGLVVKYVPSMVAGISARRLQTTPRAYFSYALRFERTYSYHHLHNPLLRAPMWVVMAIYLPGRLVHVISRRRQSSNRSADGKKTSTTASR